MSDDIFECPHLVIGIKYISFQGGVQHLVVRDYLIKTAVTFVRNQELYTIGCSSSPFSSDTTFLTILAPKCSPVSASGSVRYVRVMRSSGAMTLICRLVPSDLSREGMRTISGAVGESRFGGKEGAPEGQRVDSCRTILKAPSVVLQIRQNDALIGIKSSGAVSSVKILNVSAPPTDSPRPTNLPFCSAVSDGKPVLWAYDNASPVGK